MTSISKILSFLLYISIAVIMTSCGSSKALMGDNLQIMMKKSGCFGSCPVYELTIDKSGNALYNGIRFTDKVGNHNLQIGETKLKELVSAFEAAEINTYKSFYESNIPDLPSVTISYINGETNKTIEGKKERPEKIKELQAMLEDIAKMDGYIALDNPEEDDSEPEEEEQEEEKDPSIIEHEFIVKFNDGVIISKWLRQWKDYRLTVQKPLNNERTIWVMQYSKGSIDPDEFLAKLQADPDTESVEFNKKMEQR